MSDPAKTMLVDTDTVSEATILNCTHVEAGTRMLFQAANAVKACFQRIAIVSPNTDFFILMVHFADQIEGERWFKFSEDGRLFSAHIIAQNNGEPNFVMLI